MHEVLVNRLGGQSLPRKSVVRLTDRPEMTLDVYRGRKTTIQQHKRFVDIAFYPCQIPLINSIKVNGCSTGETTPKVLPLLSVIRVNSKRKGANSFL